MRRTTLLIISVALGLSLSLFVVKYQVQDLNDELKQVRRDIAADHEAVHVLEAEWSHLNDPDRLRALAERHLGLERIKGEQLGGFKDLPMRGDRGQETALPTSMGGSQGGRP